MNPSRHGRSMGLFLIYSVLNSLRYLSCSTYGDELSSGFAWSVGAVPECPFLASSRSFMPNFRVFRYISLSDKLVNFGASGA